MDTKDKDAGTPANVEFLPQTNVNLDGLPPRRRYLAIEADETLKGRIIADPTMRDALEHVSQLSDLVNAYYHDDEKHRLFGIFTADQGVRDFVDPLLELAIDEIQRENATVVGVVLRLIQRMIECDPVMRKQVLGPSLHDGRSSAEVKTEIECVSKTLARLEEEHAAALNYERAHPLGQAVPYKPTFNRRPV